MSRQRKSEPAGSEHPAPALRLVKTPESPRPAPDPELKAILDDLKRRHRERGESESGGKDAA